MVEPILTVIMNPISIIDDWFLGGCYVDENSAPVLHSIELLNMDPSIFGKKI